MLMQAPVMALLAVAWLGALTLLWAGAFGLQLLRHWNPASGAPRQLLLERQTELVATLVGQLLAWQGAALLLMVVNADRTAPLLVGAMCAFGSFNASVWGFPALYAKLSLFFAAGAWLALQRADRAAPDWPLTRRSYRLLLAVLLPLALADAALSTLYFTDLQPDTLTACCGSSFHPEHVGLAAEASAVAPATALWALAIGLVVVLAWGALASRVAALAPAYGLASLGFLGLGLLAVVAAISPYVYESPHHHCPFCVLKREYDHVGFVLYLPLFIGASAGLASGLLSWRPPAHLDAPLQRQTRRLRAVSMASFALFALVGAGLVVRSGLRL
ncbi:hypothetical protein KAK06_14380 [Ideonella sp. 4Y11]|uniref:Uncharacterized protein n=1 Tax=Ideonella aquatica TaxID=2824119 RepID=A0A940YH54_9BURK|nr:hypothetical protein [Ideonella aquatica]MBQ0960138.1 hypothetical protein [Ideonella aquatica]